jgi:hypothetical protein
MYTKTKQICPCRTHKAYFIIDCLSYESFVVTTIIFFFLWRYSPNLGLGLPPWNSPFHFGFLGLRQSVGLLGRVISSSQGLYLNTRQHKHRINTHTHHTSMPCVGFEPTILASERAKAVHALDARLPWPALSYIRDTPEASGMEAMNVSVVVHVMCYTVAPALNTLVPTGKGHALHSSNFNILLWKMRLMRINYADYTQWSSEPSCDQQNIITIIIIVIYYYSCRSTHR